MAKNSFIGNMYKQYGDEWVNSMRPEDIQRQGKRIVSDMVKGNVDYEKFGKFFLDLKFLDNLIISISNELQTNELYLKAVSFYKAYSPEGQTQAVYMHESHLFNLCRIYSLVLERLQMVKVSGNIGYLADISVILFNLRNNLN